MTTINTYRAGIEAIIAKLSPTGTKFGRRKFERSSRPPSEWTAKAEADIDREFLVDGWKRGEPLVFGALTTYDYLGEFSVMVGHAKTGDEHEGIDRRDTDCAKIAANIEKAANLPSGMWYMRLKSQSVRDIGKFWITTLVFRITYSLAAP